MNNQVYIENLKTGSYTELKEFNNGQLDEIDRADIVNMQSIIEDLENGKITEEEFNIKKSEILK